MKRSVPLQNSGTFIPGLGNRIREIRGALTQEAFAKHIGIPARTLMRYEAGQTIPTAETMGVICRLFRIDPWWLLFDEEASVSLSIPPSARIRVSGTAKSARDSFRVADTA